MNMILHELDPEGGLIEIRLMSEMGTFATTDIEAIKMFLFKASAEEFVEWNVIVTYAVPRQNSTRRFKLTDIDERRRLPGYKTAGKDSHSLAIK